MFDPAAMAEAESLVLAGCLSSEKAIFRILDTLTPTMFADPANAAVWSAMVGLAMSSQPVDPSLVLTGHPHLKDRVIELLKSSGSAANIESYASHVVRFYRDRELARVGREIQGIAYQGEGDKLADAMQLLMGIAATGQRGGLVAAKPRMQEVVRYIEERFNAGGGLIGHATGLTELDDLLSGLRPGCLYIVAGRPSMGKTAFALNVVMPMAREGHPVLIFSMEMPARELDLRLVASVGSIDQGQVQHASFGDDGWPRFTSATAKIAQMPLMIDDTPAQTLAAITAKAKQEAIRQGQLGAVVIDYIGLMRGEGDNRVQEIGSISRGLKALAKELNCPVIALSQLNRSCEARPDKRPLMSDLRDSGDVEQDADVVIMIYRDSVYNPDSPLAINGIGELLVRKNRHGATKDIRVIDQLKFARYVNADHAAYDIGRGGDNQRKGRGGYG